MGYEFLVAATLLLSPRELTKQEEFWLRHSVSAHALAISCDAMPPWSHWSTVNMDWVRQWAVESISLPPYEDLDRLPSTELVNDWTKINREMYAEIQSRMTEDVLNREHLRCISDELEWSHTRLSYIRYAKMADLWRLQSRRYLNEYRQMMGTQAYYSGVIPAAVPYWRFPVR